MIKHVYAFVLCTLLITAFASAKDPQLLMAKKGKRLFDDPCEKSRGKKNTALDNGWSVRAGMGIWNKKDGFYQSTWKEGIGHTPVMAFIGKSHDLIIEVTFRYGVMTKDWHTQCFRIALDNHELYTGHILSAWANPNNDFIETGFLLQHISKKADKTIIEDILYDRQPLNYKTGEWHTAILEVVGGEALFHMDGNLAYANDQRIDVDKAQFSLTFGKTAHDIRRVRVWEAQPDPGWKRNKKTVLSKRQPCEPAPHNYTKPVPVKKKK